MVRNMDFKLPFSLLVFLIFYINYSKQQTTCGTLCGSCLSTSNSKTNSINFILNVNKSYAISYPYVCGCDIFNDPYFNKSLPTFVFCPGFREDAKDFLSKQKSPNILRQVHDYSDSNVIMVDYSSMTYPTPVFGESIDYYLSVQNLKNIVYPALCKWLQCSSQIFPTVIENLSMTGFSIGAQAVGGALNNCANIRIKHCVGFDPAGPLFPTPLLNANTCDQVMCVHTNGGDNSKYGTNKNMGKIDFWINLAEQPNQSWINSTILSRYGNDPQKAAHYLAMYIAADFIQTQDRFPATKCDNSNPTETAFVGCSNLTTISGMYCADVHNF